MSASFSTVRRLVLLSLATLAARAFAEEPAPPPAKAQGPQSPVETYNAPVVQPEKLEGVIDFPKLITQPGPNDHLVVTPSLERIDVEILGTTGHDDDAFVPISGDTRAGAKRAALYAALRRKLAPYRQQPLTLGGARKIQADITAVYAELGFPLMSVVVPPQEIVGGVLRVQVNEFKLAGYRIVYGNGGGGYSPEALHWSRTGRIAAVLEPLRAEAILSKESLERAVKFINRNPYRQARVVFEPGQDRGDSTATIQIDERKPWGIEAGYNNYATKVSGTHRFSLGGNVGNLPLPDQQVSWNVTVGTSLRDFQNYSLIYTVPVGARQKVSANLNYSDTISSSIPGIDSASKTLQTSLEYDLSLVDTQAFSSNLSVSGVLKRFKRASIFGDVTVGGASFDSAQLQINQQFNWREKTATNQVVLGTVQSFSGLTARNSDEDFRTFYNSTDGRARTQQYSVNYARVQQLSPMLKSLDGWTTETQLSWQWANRELAGSDAFSVGGPSTLRAYPASAVNGDDGFYWIQLLHLKPWALGGGKAALGIQQIAVSPLFEAGWTRYIKGGHEHVWDAGLDVKLGAAHNFSVSASLAFAGRTVGDVNRGDARVFVGAHWAY